MTIKNLPGTLWKAITRPSNKVVDAAERRRAELLAGLTFFFAVLNLIGLIIGSRSGNLFGELVLTILAVSLITAYILSRSQYYRIGVWIALGIWTVVTFGYALSGNTTNGPLFAFSVFLPLVLAFGAAWLDLKNLSVFLGIVIIGYLLSPRIEPAIAGRQFYLLFGILICLGLLLLVTQNYRDLVEQERLETIRGSEARLRTLINTIPDLVWLKNLDGVYLSCNSKFERFFGAKEADIVGKTDYDFTDKELADLFRENDKAAMAANKPMIYEEQVTYAEDGHKELLETIKTPMYDSRSRIIGILGIARDITERKNAEHEREILISELEARNTELTQFTYTVSHDLKSPLVTINGFLGYLEQDAKSGNLERLKKDTQRIKEAVNKMHALLTELLELSRIGHMINTPINIPFETLVKDAMDMVHGQLEKHNVSVQIQPNLSNVHGDRQRLTEVLQNLIDNAAKYMGDQTDPQIEIGQSGEDDGKPVFFVKDNGMGISSEYHERIFGIFNKLDARSEGTGIGLALVKSIIEVHGGRVWVESEFRKGSTFYFTLPRG